MNDTGWRAVPDSFYLECCRHFVIFGIIDRSIDLEQLIMQKFLPVIVILILTAGCRSHDGDELADLHYDVSFPNAEHNEAEITLKASGLDPVPVQISMSRASPGRYALHEFAKNV